MTPVSISRWASVFVFLFLFCGTSAAQNAPGNEIARTVRFNSVDLAHLMAQLAADQELPIGFEVDIQKPRSAVFLDLKNVTALEALEAAVRAEPVYQWHNGGDFIEVFPVKGRSVFLDTPISSFDLNDVDGAQAIEQLMSRPEVEAIRRSMNLVRQPEVASAGRRDDPKFSLHLEATTLRQALNQISKRARTNFWIYRASRDGSFFLGLSPR